MNNWIKKPSPVKSEKEEDDNAVKPENEYDMDVAHDEDDTGQLEEKVGFFVPLMKKLFISFSIFY